MRTGRRVVLAVMMGLAACKRPTVEPSICSPEGVARMRAAGATEDVIRRTCSSADAGTPGPGAQPTEAAPSTPPTTWKKFPTPLTIIKADPPSYKERPTLVFVALKPSDYFNFGYSGARNTHFAFELHPVVNDAVSPETLHGYAGRSWARPFFEAVTKALAADNGKYQYTTATLVVAYKAGRYDGRSADHIEILAASLNEDFTLDPDAVASALAAEKGAAAERRTTQREKCSDEFIRTELHKDCLGMFALNRLTGGRQTFDSDYFCRCMSRRANVNYIRRNVVDCDGVDSAALARYMDSDAVVLACRR